MLFQNLRLRQCAQNGDLEGVSKILAAGGSADSGRYAALYLAVKNGHTAVVAALLAKGADLSKALIDAAAKQDVSTAQKILTLAALTGTKDAVGAKALNQVAKSGRILRKPTFTIATLVAAGVNPNGTHEGQTPLQAAVTGKKYNTLTVVKALLANGANPALATESSQLPAQLTSKPKVKALLQSNQQPLLESSTAASPAPVAASTAAAVVAAPTLAAASARKPTSTKKSEFQTILDNSSSSFSSVSSAQSRQSDSALNTKSNPALQKACLPRRGESRSRLGRNGKC